MLTPEGQLQSNRAFVRGLASRYGDGTVRRVVGWCALAGAVVCIVAALLAG